MPDKRQEDNRKRGSGGVVFFMLIVVYAMAIMINFVFLRQMTVREYEETMVSLLDVRGIKLGVAIREPLMKYLRLALEKGKMQGNNWYGQSSQLLGGGIQQHEGDKFGISTQLRRVWKVFVESIKKLLRGKRRNNSLNMALHEMDRLSVGTALVASMCLVIFDTIAFLINCIFGAVFGLFLGFSAGLMERAKPKLMLIMEGKMEIPFLSAFRFFMTTRNSIRLVFFAFAMYMLGMPFAAFKGGPIGAAVVVIITTVASAYSVSVLVRTLVGRSPKL